MSKGRNFIDREVFEELIRSTPRRDGGEYQDIATIYGDMSRLVVAWLASTNPSDLCKCYNKLEWGGTANAHAMHEAARAWYAKYHPNRLPE
jgi:hypothetical protein